MKRHLLGVTAAVLGTVLISGAGMYSSAVAAGPVPTTVTLPLFGAAVTFDITTDAGGAITDVAVDPADGTVATKLKPHKVVFKSANPADPADSARVVIKSGHGGQSVSARAGSLADFSTAAGGWSGDVFGTGEASSVPFTIGDAGDGTPTITVGAPVLAAGVSAVVGAVEVSSHDGHDDESSSSARVSVKFTTATGDQSRSLRISVKVKTDEDGHTSAKLSMSLGRIKGVEGMAVGSHMWTGFLCDNTPASIGYTVLAGGTITVDSTTPAGATSEISDHGAKVSFATGESVRIKVSSHDDQLRVSAQEKARCNSAGPTTNAEISIPPDNGDHHDGDHHDGGNRGGHGGNKGGQNG